MAAVGPETVNDFWFTLSPAKWYSVNADLDAEIKAKFEATVVRAKAGELWQWRDTPDGRLAEIIVLDQFSRNIYRGTPDAFAADALSLVLAQEAVRHGVHLELQDAMKRNFLLLPYMHSESRAVHEEALKLFEGLPGYDFEVSHKAHIDKFGRYPHRNAVLGRESTPEEMEFLKENKGW